MIVYPIYMFDDQWPFCLFAMATLNFKKEFLNDNSSKTTKAVGLESYCFGGFGTNVAWHRTIQNSEKFGGLLLGLVAMATESSHRLIMGKW